MPHIYAVSCLVSRVQHYLQVECHTVTVVADSFPEAMEKGREKIIEYELNDDGWTILKTQARAPSEEQILTVADAIRASAYIHTDEDYHR
jgi:hypothetical protein